MTTTTVTAYDELLRKPQWTIKRNAILKRDGYKCRNCGADKQLQVHHRQYHFQKSNGLKKDPWQYQDEILITLCNACHQQGHQYYKVPVFPV